MWSDQLSAGSTLFLLRLIAEQPDSTLDEVVLAMRKRRIAEAVAVFGASSSTAVSASKACGRPGVLSVLRARSTVPGYRTLPSRGHRRPQRICRIPQSDPRPQA